MGYTGPGLLLPLCKSWNIEIFDRVKSINATQLKALPPESLLAFDSMEKLTISTVDSEKLEHLLIGQFEKLPSEPNRKYITTWQR